MRIRNLNIGLRLGLGFAIIIVFSIVIGVASLRNISSATKTTEDMYVHPLAVSNAVRDINANVIAIHRSMKDVVLSQNEEELLAAEHLVDHYEEVVYEKFEIVFDQFLGDIEDVQNAHKSFSDWKPIREEVIRSWNLGKSAEAIAITKGKGAVHVNKVLDHVKVMMDFANTKAETFYASTKEKERQSYNSMLILLFVLLLLSVVIVIVFTRSLVVPIKKLSRVANVIAGGDLSVRHVVLANDEIGCLARSFNEMTNSVESRNRILSGLTAISEVMHDKIKLTEFAEGLLSKIAELTYSQMATFYILKENQNRYVPLASVGANVNLLRAFDAENPPGDFDRVIRSKRIYSLRNIPNNTIFLYRSIIGDLIPKEVVTIPILSGEKVIALISCVAIRPFAKESLDVVQQAQPLIAASFSTLLANRRKRKYAEKLVEMNQELEMQSEELQQQAEELQQQSNELKISSDNLLEQNVELEMQRRQVEQANRLKSEFLSNMSHELRTPLNSINALSNVLIMQSAGKLDEDETNYLKIIERNGKRLLSLINDILDLSKVEAGKMEVHIQPFSLNSSLLLVTESLQSLADEKGIELKLEIKEDINIESDESRLNQVVTNILGNAIKFTEKGLVEVACEKRGEQAIIEIKDSGIGIAKDILPLIFQEFRQADGTTSRAYEGTGLGLAISNKILEVLKGTIRVESELGVGSTFTVELPLKQRGWEIKDSTNVIPPNKSDGNTKTILVVDDDKQLVNDISAKLEKEGYATLKAYSGKDAIKMAIKYQPYAITLDIIMPEIDGWEVLQQLQQNPSTANIPVTIISKSDDLDTSFALGAVGYVQKPVNKRLLISEILKIRQNAKKIAIVDDSEVDRMQICRVLENENLENIVFENGEQCLNYLESELPDVLILDLMMPKMNGFQLLKQIRGNANSSNLPVIVVTAKDLTDNERDFLNGRAASILTKGDATKTEIVNDIYRIIKQLENKQASNRLKTILIVEDNESAVIQIRKVLENTGLGVDHVKGGKEALEYVTNTIPDGIILDLMMPEMDGFEVLEKIRGSESTQNIPVLILTAKNLSQSDLNKLSSNNIQQLIQKGDVNISELVRKVNIMLGVETIPQKEFVSDLKPTLSKKKPNTSKKPKVLIVEDNPDNRIIARAIIGNKYEIIEAEDGELGLQKVVSEHPDLILLDISLPKKDGFSVVKEIRENQEIKDIPIIALTAKAMKGDREKIVAAGCDEYVSKPINGEELLKKISLLLS